MHLIHREPVIRSPIGFVRGYTWGWTGRRGTWRDPRALESMRRLRATGTDWLVLAFAKQMPTHTAAEIRWRDADDVRTVDEAEVRFAIAQAHGLGFKVLLKPTVNCDDEVWRGQIAPGSRLDLERWWAAYADYQEHYAAVARDTGCAALCIGCEMNSRQGDADGWRLVARRARVAFGGPLVYNANHGCERAAFWDAVDVIGISAYYRVGLGLDTGLSNMLAKWCRVRDRLRRLAVAHRRPLMHIEIGMCPVQGLSRRPWDWHHAGLPWDGDEQARFYESALRTFHDLPWFCGWGWWDWPVHLREGHASDRGFHCCGKPAETVLRRWYARPR